MSSEVNDYINFQLSIPGSLLKGTLNIWVSIFIFEFSVKIFNQNVEEVLIMSKNVNKAKLTLTQVFKLS